MSRKNLNRILLAVAVVVAMAMVPLAMYSYSQFSVGLQMDEVLAEDERNQGFDVAVHYLWFVDSSTLVFDVRSYPDGAARVDLFRILLQYASKLKDEELQEVRLCFQGEAIFVLPGEDFRTIGAEYGEQNVVYTMRKFPQSLKEPDGTPAFSSYSGGLLGAATAEIEDFNKMSDQWWFGRQGD